jgi:hypothetical protein
MSFWVQSLMDVCINVYSVYTLKYQVSMVVVNDIKTFCSWISLRKTFKFFHGMYFCNDMPQKKYNPWFHDLEKKTKESCMMTWRFNPMCHINLGPHNIYAIILKSEIIWRNMWLSKMTKNHFIKKFLIN